MTCRCRKMLLWSEPVRHQGGTVMCRCMIKSEIWKSHTDLHAAFCCTRQSAKFVGYVKSELQACLCVFIYVRVLFCVFCTSPYSYVIWCVLSASALAWGYRVPVAKWLVQQPCCHRQRRDAMQRCIVHFLHPIFKKFVDGPRAESPRSPRAFVSTHSEALAHSSLCSLCRRTGSRCGVVGGALPSVSCSPRNKHHVEDGMGEEVHVCAQIARQQVSIMHVMCMYSHYNIYCGPTMQRCRPATFRRCLLFANSTHQHTHTHIHTHTHTHICTHTRRNTATHKNKLKKHANTYTYTYIYMYI